MESLALAAIKSKGSAENGPLCFFTTRPSLPSGQCMAHHTKFPAHSSSPTWRSIPPTSMRSLLTLPNCLWRSPSPADPRHAGLPARWPASASLFDNHLWQDLRLSNRRMLSVVLGTHFPELARRNTGNMRWKAFFYKQLCEGAGMVCRAPSCGACDDYNECFGSEESVVSTAHE